MTTPATHHEFWYEVTMNAGKETERTELKIDYRAFVAFLEHHGFGLLITNTQVRIVRVVDNVVSDTLKEGSMNVTIKRFVLDWLQDQQRDDCNRQVQVTLRRRRPPHEPRDQQCHPRQKKGFQGQLQYEDGKIRSADRTHCYLPFSLVFLMS